MKRVKVTENIPRDGGLLRKLVQVSKPSLPLLKLCLLWLDLPSVLALAKVSASLREILRRVFPLKEPYYYSTDSWQKDASCLRGSPCLISLPPKLLPGFLLVAFETNWKLEDRWSLQCRYCLQPVFLGRHRFHGDEIRGFCQARHQLLGYGKGVPLMAHGECLPPPRESKKHSNVILRLIIRRRRDVGLTTFFEEKLRVPKPLTHSSKLPGWNFRGYVEGLGCYLIERSVRVY